MKIREKKKMERRTRGEGAKREEAGELVVLLVVLVVLVVLLVVLLVVVVTKAVFLVLYLTDPLVPLRVY